MNINITGQNRQSFDQGLLLDTLKKTYGNSAVEQEAVNSIGRGICYMLSLEWLLKLLKTPQAYPASIYDNNFRNATTLMYYKQVANNYYKYSSDFGYTFVSHIGGHPGTETISGSNIQDIDKKYVECCSDKKHTVQDTNWQFDSPTDITGMFAGDCALLIYLKVVPNNPQISRFAHEMALWRYNGSSWFYDPNMGVFELTDFSQIVGEIMNGYTANISGGAQARIIITQLN